ncbi:hypothetical protein OG728_38425 (plasmid) [Streptomyces microflavus]|uniref:hypothetical protein n=1 Tax=Streptomyces microflavus TaxID=1919 RepID=UPI002E0E30E1|nr:hypothetical protein OG728_38425 [Streptomyces microflavus]
MAEPGNTPVSWNHRMELLRDSAQQRVLTAPMPTAAMEQLLADGKAHALGQFEDSPVRYMDRWWRTGESGWVALDEGSSAQLDVHAERYSAAIGALGQARPPATPELAPPPAAPADRAVA